MLAVCFRRPVCYFKFENNFYYQLIKQLKTIQSGLLRVSLRLTFIQYKSLKDHSHDRLYPLGNRAFQFYD
ncbi:Uncharacterised protein [Neisseria flavescens]|nr:Uncharacterised protein [Neisseria meningitidis]SPY10246.1 Uncharacterised protein [Neisseria meningitidis]STZ65153.1 Uncharacterised protein [Neisseria flavescens]